MNSATLVVDLFLYLNRNAVLDRLLVIGRENLLFMSPQSGLKTIII